MLLKDVKVGEKFFYNNEVFTRLSCENKITIVYRCVLNIIAINSDNTNVVLIDQNEHVKEIL
jgi:hypothetical protein